MTEQKEEKNDAIVTFKKEIIACCKGLQHIRIIDLFGESFCVLQEVAKELGKKYVYYDYSNQYITQKTSNTQSQPTFPDFFAEVINSGVSNSMLVVDNIDKWFQLDHGIDSLLRKACGTLKDRNIIVLVSVKESDLPAEFGRIFRELEMPAPDRSQVKSYMSSAAEQLKGKEECKKGEIDVTYDDQVLDILVENCMGLQIQEIDQALRMKVSKNKGFNIKIAEPLLLDKAQRLASRGHKIVMSDVTVADVGDLGQLKEDTEGIKLAFSEFARLDGIPMPSGFILVGGSGCGKSLAAKMIASQLGGLLSEYKHEMDSLLGNSEKNFRRFLKTNVDIVKGTNRPVTIWFDEAEKLFGNTGGREASGDTQGRILQEFLTWLQWKTDNRISLFVLLTCNIVQILPAELLRPERFDAVYYVPLPGKRGRVEIFKIHISKILRNPEDFDLEKLACMTKDFSGAEIKNVIKLALIKAHRKRIIAADGKFDGKLSPLTTEDIIEIIKTKTPLAHSMSEQISLQRKWGEQFAVNASFPEPEATIMDSISFN